jgi:hypothetical protein
LLLWLALLCKTVVAEDAHSVLEEAGSSCKRDGELGVGRRGTASDTISCGGLALLTAEVSMVMVGLVILIIVSMYLPRYLNIYSRSWPLRRPRRCRKVIGRRHIE